MNLKTAWDIVLNQAEKMRKRRKPDYVHFSSAWLNQQVRRIYCE